MVEPSLTVGLPPSICLFPGVELRLLLVVIIAYLVGSIPFAKRVLTSGKQGRVEPGRRMFRAELERRQVFSRSCLMR